MKNNYQVVCIKVLKDLESARKRRDLEFFNKVIKLVVNDFTQRKINQINV